METYIEKPRELRGSLNEIILSEGLKIPNYEDYLIFKEGFVVSLKGKAPIVLKEAKGGYKLHYSFVVLSMDGKTKPINIHILVATAYVPNPYNKPQVNHIDGDTDNNDYTNLEWVTAEENSQHAMDTGLSPQGADCPWAKYSSDTVRQICEMLTNNESTTKIRLTLGVPSYLICGIKSRTKWKSISSEYDF